MQHPARVPLPLTLLAALLAGKAMAGDLFVDSLDVPQVLTATRLKQSPRKCPAA